MGKLPQNPKKGQIAVLKRKGRKITFKATGRRFWQVAYRKQRESIDPSLARPKPDGDLLDWLLAIDMLKCK